MRRICKLALHRGERSVKGVDILSILLVGDSHINFFPVCQSRVDLRDLNTSVQALLQPRFIGAAFAASVDILVTYPDGRLELNPRLKDAIHHWPGLDNNGRPETTGANVQKHLVLGLGTSLAAYDPAMTFADREQLRLYFSPHV